MIKLKALLFEQNQPETVNDKITRLYNEVNGTLAKLNSDIKATGEEQLNRTAKNSELATSAQLSGTSGQKFLQLFWRMDVVGGGVGKSGGVLNTFKSLRSALKGVANVSRYPMDCAWSFGTTKQWTTADVIKTAGRITTALTEANEPPAPKSLAIWNAWLSQNAPKITELLNTIISAFPDGTATWEESPGNAPGATTRVVGGDKPVVNATASTTTPPAAQG